MRLPLVEHAVVVGAGASGDANPRRRPQTPPTPPPRDASGAPSPMIAATMPPAVGGLAAIRAANRMLGAETRPTRPPPTTTYPTTT